MKQIVVQTFLILMLFQNCPSESSSSSIGSEPVDHRDWSILLQKHVNERGEVDYFGILKDSVDLQTYLSKLKAHPPDEKGWSEAEKLAYWINVYNAFTIKLIIDHYPLKSIKDIGSSIQIPFINSPWDIRFIPINGKKLDLNNIEHTILRKKFDEPRIHFAINCASFSCPKLRREAYEANKLEAQLNEQAIDFLNDHERNKINAKKAEVSKIFSWFRRDFTRQGSLRDFINQYSNTKIGKETKISYMPYDWSLNETKR